jgi:hypothetical protein
VLALVGFAVALSIAHPGAAQTARRVGLDLTLSHASAHPGPIDPAAAALHQRLLDEFHYQSLRVLQRRRLDLKTGEIGGLDLPSGKRVRIRPLHLGEAGVLLAVDIDGTLQTDLRVRNRRPVLIGIERYEDGRLILMLQPDY